MSGSGMTKMGARHRIWVKVFSTVKGKGGSGEPTTREVVHGIAAHGVVPVDHPPVAPCDVIRVYPGIHGNRAGNTEAGTVRNLHIVIRSVEAEPRTDAPGPVGILDRHDGRA